MNMSYLPIENYGLIGNMHSVALVGTNGSIDWLCLPKFDSPSIFGSILDIEKGGSFQIHPACQELTTKQFYWPDTNVLVTRFFTEKGVSEVIDFMPVDERNYKSSNHKNRIIRQVKVVKGCMEFELNCDPAFNYAREKHSTHLSPNGVCFTTNDLSVSLSSSLPLELNSETNGVKASFVLKENESTTFTLESIEAHNVCPIGLTEEQAEQEFIWTVQFWRKWLSKCTYKGRWRETIYRSALTLKMLTYAPTGAIVAAATCSLPEGVGGERNWDYRYTWIRDAAFTVYAFLRIGFTEEAKAFMQWLEKRCQELKPNEPLQIMYGIDGRKDLIEEHLEHLEGYKRSRPVRVGNGAYDQLQLDIYGELMDSVYLYNKYGEPISYELWTHLEELINWLCDNWQQPDEGVWEVRGGKQHFVYSRLMSWVAFDRAIRLAEKRSFPCDRFRWMEIRDEIYKDIVKNGWNEDKQAFVQYYGSDTLDAANLMMPLVFFMSPTDPMMVKTLDAMNKPPHQGGLVSNSLVYRYNVEETSDGLKGEEGTFNICTFWFVEALTRAGKGDKKKLEEARLMFEKMLGYANHLEIFAEETGNLGEALGNTPQAFTHLALISAAFNLDRALDRK
ncbi:MAG: glycoside hydrolase family 15 protein [Candidatus Caenarcaniphilales bacterium]|nr:glycoside hydrolase family 15 protein [Candidatus Caenarcaniphilales bacterium]